MKSALFSAVLVCAGLLMAAGAFAEEVTLLYTGETHAMLYPCNCPVEPDGGISRRASLVRAIKKERPNTLLLDCGAFSAGGLMDEYSQTAELDSQRTRLNMKAMAAMAYDAAACGDEELFYGVESLKSRIAGWTVPFVCTNMAADFVKPYLIKEAGSLRFGIIAAITDTAAGKAGDLRIEEAAAAAAAAVKELRSRNVDVIVLLSHLGETSDLALLEKVSGIDILVSGNGRQKTEPFSMVGRTLLLRPSWQGRRLGRADLVFKDKKLIDFKVEEVRLSDAIAADKGIASFLPACFSERNCTREGRGGTCQKPATMQASCVFPAPVKIPITVITDKKCRTCDTGRALDIFKKSLPGLSPVIMQFSDREAKPLLDLFQVSTLPVYLFSRELEKAPEFGKIADRFLQKGDWYMLKLEHGGIGLFLDRPESKGSFDLFLSIADPNTAAILGVVEEFRPEVRLIAGVDDSGALAAPGGAAELEEMLRCVCVQKYYPGLFWNYLSARARDIRSAWWEDALGPAVDPAPVRSCARSDEGRRLLIDHTALGRQLGINNSPAYLLNNREIFSSQKIPAKEELRRIIHGK